MTAVDCRLKIRHPYELRKTIVETNDEFWKVLRVGPYFHDRIYVAGDLKFTGSSHAHYYRAVLNSDIDISIEWGMDGGDDRDENHLWAESAGFPDPRTHTQGVDIFYRGALVDRTETINVDGSRSYVPQYKIVRVDGGEMMDMEDAKYEFHASYWDYYLTQLINQLMNHSDFERYVKQSGIILAPGSSSFHD